jgi:hypothetical protein
MGEQKPKQIKEIREIMKKTLREYDIQGEIIDNIQEEDFLKMLRRKDTSKKDPFSFLKHAVDIVKDHVVSLRNIDSVVKRLMEKGIEQGTREITEWKKKHPRVMISTERPVIKGLSPELMENIQDTIAKLIKNTKASVPRQEVKEAIDASLFNPKLTTPVRKLIFNRFPRKDISRRELREFISELNKIKQALILKDLGIDVHSELAPRAFFTDNPFVLLIPKKPSMEELAGSTQKGEISFPYYGFEKQAQEKSLAVSEAHESSFWNPEEKRWEPALEVKIMQSMFNLDQLSNSMRKKVATWPRNILFWHILSALERGLDNIIIRSDQRNLGEKKINEEARKFIYETMPKKLGFKLKEVGISPTWYKLKGSIRTLETEAGREVGIMKLPFLKLSEMSPKLKKAVELYRKKA